MFNMDWAKLAAEMNMQMAATARTKTLHMQIAVLRCKHAGKSNNYCVVHNQAGAAARHPQFTPPPQHTHYRTMVIYRVSLPQMHFEQPHQVSLTTTAQHLQPGPSKEKPTLFANNTNGRKQMNLLHCIGKLLCLPLSSCRAPG
jgi:hypothetical protein